MQAQTALVTGGGSGMGQLAAWRLAEGGARVAVLDINEAGMAETAAKHSDRISTYVCDIADAGAVQEVVTDVVDDLGSLDVVMNAAGMARAGDTLGLGPDTIMRMMAVNYGGTVNIASAVLPGMLRRGSGHLVNFGSLAGWIVSKRLTPYCATKFAVNSFTEGLHLEYGGRGVGIHCVCPPAVKTPMLGDFFPEKKQKMTMAITSEKVLDAIETGIADDRLYIFPGAAAGGLWRMRRHFPRLTAKVIGLPALDLAHQ